MNEPLDPAATTEEKVEYLARNVARLLYQDERRREMESHDFWRNEGFMDGFIWGMTVMAGAVLLWVIIRK